MEDANTVQLVRVRIKIKEADVVVSIVDPGSFSEANVIAQQRVQSALSKDMILEGLDMEVVETEMEALKSFG